MTAVLAPVPEQPPAIENTEAEAALLGALMVDNRALERVADLLEPDDFYLPAHAKIFSALQRDVIAGKVASPVTLRPYFEGDPDFSELGGYRYLAQLTGSGAALIGHRDIAQQVRELAQRRRLLASLQAIAVRDWNKTFAEIVAEAETAIAEAGRESDEGIVECTIGEAADRALKEAEDDTARVRCGIDPIDAALGPLFIRDLTIVAGRPGMGKSVFGQNYARGASERGHAAVMFSLEMRAEQLGARALAEMTFEPGTGRGAVPLDVVLARHKSREQVRRLLEAKDRLDALPFEVVDVPGCTVAKLNTLIRRWKRRYAAQGKKLELVVVDYLQLMIPDFRVRGGDRTEAITYISQGLKRAAKANDVHIIALSQLSRAVEQREDKRPHLSDLRDSGSIEQDADNVLFLFRAEYYLSATEPPIGDDKRARYEELLESCKNKLELLVPKRRMGKTGKAFGEFHAPFQAIRAGLG